MDGPRRKPRAVRRFGNLSPGAYLVAMSKKPAPMPMVYRLVAIGLFVLFVAWLLMVW